MFNRKLPWQRLLPGLLFSTGVGLFAYRRRSLSRSGVAGAMVTGSVTVGMGGWAWGLSLIYFFASSSLLSHFRSHDKERTAADKFSKGSQRDILQVMANGGVATALSLAHGLTRSQSAQDLLQAGYTGALATANGDTWATELGVLNTRQPRLITTGKPVPPGTSGGITLLGTCASAAGGLSLGLVFWLLEKVGAALARPLHIFAQNTSMVGTALARPRPYPPTDSHIAQTGTADGLKLSLPVIGLLSGLAGSLADSLMGATIQAMYYCPTCEKETERRIHGCGTPTLPLRGIPWFDNDVVNFIATLFGALVGIGLPLGIQFSKKDTQV
ncbi:MAG: DUF92 domain-containing protein [Ktedonobacteraceae bacterium]